MSETLQMDQKKGDAGVSYDCEFLKTPPLPLDLLRPLFRWRDRMHDEGLIGQQKDGSHFGNISMRYGRRGFIISGDETAGEEHLDERGFTEVMEWDFDRRHIHCRGPVPAPEQALLHAMIYDLDERIHGVVSGYDTAAWKKLRDKKPTTPEETEYLSADLAREILRLWEIGDLRDQKIVVLGSREGALISFGRDLDEAARLISE